MFRETDYFQLWILYKIDLRISTAEEHMGNLRFKLLKKKNFPGTVFLAIMFRLIISAGY